MTQVNVDIVDISGTKLTPVALPSDVPLSQLISVLVAKMDLPTTDESGRFVIYRMFRHQTNRALRDEDTLSSAGVKNGDRFTLVPRLAEAGQKIHYEVPPEKNVVEAVDLSAPIFVPSADSLAIGLVPASIVDRWEEYRSDQTRWEGAAWAFIGAALGVTINWVTQEPIIMTRASIIVLCILLLMSIITSFAARDYKNRALRMKSQMLAVQSNSRRLTENS